MMVHKTGQEIIRVHKFLFVQINVLFPQEFLNPQAGNTCMSVSPCKASMPGEQDKAAVGSRSSESSDLATVPYQYERIRDKAMGIEEYYDSTYKP